LKTQVTVEYKKDGGATIPLRVDTVVISTQHAEEISTEDLRKEILEKVIKQVIPKNLLDDRTIYHVWPFELVGIKRTNLLLLLRFNRRDGSSLAVPRVMLA